MFNIIQKTIFNLQVEIKNENNVARVLTGRTCEFILKHKNDTSDNDDKAVLIKTQILNDANANAGIIIISLNSVETDIKKGNYKFEIITYTNAQDRETHVQDFIEVDETYIKE